MNFTQILGKAWRFTWQHKPLWLLGFMAGLSGHLFSVISRFLTYLYNNITPSDPQSFFNAIDNYFIFLNESSQGWIDIALYSVLFLLVITILWLVNLVAEGGLVRAVERDVWGRPVGLREAVQDGLNVLKRYIVVDTLLLLPVFAITVVAMLVLVGITIVFTYGINAGWDIVVVFQRMALGLVCLVPIIVLLMPASFLTAIARRVAFRTVGLGDWGAREGVRVMWQECRQNLSPFILMIILFIGIQTIASGGIALLTIPFSASNWLTILQTGSPNADPTTLQSLFRLVGDLLKIVLQSILYVYISACWTLAYRDWTRVKRNATAT